MEAPLSLPAANSIKMTMPAWSDRASALPRIWHWYGPDTGLSLQLHWPDGKGRLSAADGAQSSVNAT